MEYWYFENQLIGFGYRFKVKEYLEKIKSKFQEIEVLETYDYGKLLNIDGLVMLTERDEFFYHEIISHPALFTHLSPKKVLIIGGGDCGTLREVLKHECVNEVHLCEIDEEVIKISEKYFDFTKKALKDKRTKVFIEDGFIFLMKNKNNYDIIIVDSTDPLGEAKKLFEDDFFNLCYQSLNEAGILVGQSGCFFYDQTVPLEVYRSLKNKFPIYRLYMGLTPTYPSGFWSFYFGSKKYCMLNDVKKEKIINSKLDFKYYNEDIHFACMALPNFLRNKITG